MPSLFRIRVLAVSGTRLWCAGSGPVTARISRAVHDELTELCAGMTVVGLDLRELALPEGASLPRAPWPDGPHTIHLLAPAPLRTQAARDARVHWHDDLRAAWETWCALPA